MAKDLKDSPLISVVMSVYNGSEYIDEAVKSILNQTFKDFEFIIVNDGSTDDSLAKLQSYKDPRIKIINQENQGLVASLNTAIAMTSTPIIARQDADDVSLTNRFDVEYKVLANNPKVILIGSSIITIDESGKELNQHRVLVDNAELKQELLVRSPFAHGSVMLKKDAYIKAGKYQKDDWPAEDYGLWLRMASFGNFINTDEPLYKYRENSQSISASNQEHQQNKKMTIQKRAWSQRQLLINGTIGTNQYKKMTMGEYRIERITHNLLNSLKNALLHFDLISAFKVTYLILSDKNLVRKSTRFLLIRLKLKHV